MFFDGYWSHITKCPCHVFLKISIPYSRFSNIYSTDFWDFRSPHLFPNVRGFPLYVFCSWSYIQDFQHILDGSSGFLSPLLFQHFHFPICQILRAAAAPAAAAPMRLQSNNHPLPAADDKPAEEIFPNIIFPKKDSGIFLNYLECPGDSKDERYWFWESWARPPNPKTMKMMGFRV